MVACAQEDVVIRRMTVVTAETLETDPDNFFAELWADASPFYMYGHSS